MVYSGGIDSNVVEAEGFEELLGDDCWSGGIPENPIGVIEETSPVSAQTNT